MGQADCEEEMRECITHHACDCIMLENEKLKAQLEVATDSLMKIARSDPPGYLKEVEVGYLMNEAREALKKIEEMK